MDNHKSKTKWAVGDRFLIRSGSHSGEEAVSKEFDIIGVKDLGWRCYVVLTTGDHRGQIICAYTRQLERLEGQSTASRKNKVLVVEDDRDTQELIRHLLSAAGFDVLTADDGERALGALKHFRPDLILTDLMMPHVSGMELIRCVKEEPMYADIPVVVITAYGDRDKGAAAAAGAVTVLDKPAAIHNIADMISDLVH